MSVTIKEGLLKERFWKEQDFGVEIEMEGDNLVTDYSPWRVERDGSLRGGVEYVLKKPCYFDDLPNVLERLKKRLVEHEVNLVPSDRTGIHLHMNVGDLTPIQLVNFLCAYYILEEAIVETCGENRIGNHFCLRAIDAEAVISQICSSTTNNNIQELNDDAFRYSALNLTSLFKYGTLEFRAIQTSVGFERAILPIASMLFKLKETSQRFNVPEEILSEYSGFGVEGLIGTLLETTQTHLNGVPNVSEKFKRGMRLAQDVAYSRDFDPQSFNWGLTKKLN